MLQAFRDLQEQKAPWVPREKEVPLVREEPLGFLGQQGLLELWVHRELRVLGALQDSRGTEVLLETEELGGEVRCGRHEDRWEGRWEGRPAGAWGRELHLWVSGPCPV